MTNEEAICLIGNIQFDLTDGYYQREDYIEALCIFDQLNQEKTKLKAEIENSNRIISNMMDEHECGIVGRNIEIVNLKAEIKRLNGKSEMYRDMADSFCNNNIKLKAEIEQLKATISEMETTTAQEDDLK